MADKKSEEIEAQPMALFAFLAALVALLVSLIKKKSVTIINVVMSTLGFIFLLLLKFSIDGDSALNSAGQ